jgi:hypothetical protein
MADLGRSCGALTMKSITIIVAGRRSTTVLCPRTIVAIEDGLPSDVVGTPHRQRGYEVKLSEATEAADRLCSGESDAGVRVTHNAGGMEQVGRPCAFGERVQAA